MLQQGDSRESQEDKGLRAPFVAKRDGSHASEDGRYGKKLRAGFSDTVTLAARSPGRADVPELKYPRYCSAAAMLMLSLLGSRRVLAMHGPLLRLGGRL
jgi:hypothetical protein